MFSKHRIEALSDAVFAIAMTLLILDIKVPAEHDPAGLGYALLHQTPEWISFVITFALTSVFWTFQHRVFDLLDNVGTESLALTFLFLGFVTVLPFSTALWGHHIKEPLAFIVYFLNQFLIAGALTLKLERARMHGHLHLGREASKMRLRLAFFSGLMGYAALISVVLPIQYLWAAILPLALVGRYLRRRQEKKLAIDVPAPELHQLH